MAAPVRVDHPVAPRESLAEQYHEESKYAPHTLPRLLANHRRHDAWRAAQPFPLLAAKRYPGAPLVPLPKPARLWRPLGWALRRRRSARPAEGAFPLRELGTLLQAMHGRRADGSRAQPSAGALHPLEAYVLARAVGGLPDGCYHHDIIGHGLEPLGQPASAAPWFVEPGAFEQAAALVVLTAVMPRLEVKYGERAYRFALLEAGHAAQNLLLAAAARGLAATPVGGYFDDHVHDALGLDGVEEIALYVLAIGRRAPP